MRNKKTISLMLYALCMGLLVLWMVIATPLIAQWTGKNEIKATNFSQYQGKDHVYYAFEEISVQNGTTSNLTCSGWALVKTNNINQERKVSLVLASDSHCYEVCADIGDRSDVKFAFPGTKLQSIRVGFMIDVSTLKIANGVYDLYIYCWENKLNYGLIDTYYQIKKSNDGVELYCWSGQKVTETRESSSTSEVVYGGIEKIQVFDDALQIEGWGNIPSKDSITQTTFIKLTDEAGNIVQYTAKHVLRDEVALYFDNLLLEYSGFFSSIPAAEISDGKYTVTFLVENENTVLESNSYLMEKENYSISWQEKPA